MYLERWLSILTVAIGELTLTSTSVSQDLVNICQFLDKLPILREARIHPHQSGRKVVLTLER